MVVRWEGVCVQGWDRGEVGGRPEEKEEEEGALGCEVLVEEEGEVARERLLGGEGEAVERGEGDLVGGVGGEEKSEGWCRVDTMVVSVVVRRVQAGVLCFEVAIGTFADGVGCFVCRGLELGMVT